MAARAKLATPDSEIMYDSTSDKPESHAADAPAKSRDDGASAQPTSDAAEAEQPQASTMLVGITQSVSVSVPNDGSFTEFDQAGLDAMAPIVERHNLGREVTQELFNLHLAQVQQEWARSQQAYAEYIQTQADEHRAELLKQTKADPELRAYGLENAKKTGQGVLRRFFDPQFVSELRATGLLSHPEFIRGLLRINEHSVAARVRGAGYDYKPKMPPPRKAEKRGRK